MKNFDQKWQKLVARARQTPEERDAAAPYGFATRVAARALTAPAVSAWAVLERLTLRGLAVAAVLMVATAAFNYPALALDNEDELAMTDAVTEALDLS